MPVIACGGAGSPEDFIEVITKGAADAVAAAHVFHYKKHSIAEVKNALAEAGIPVRRVVVQPASV